MKGIKKLLSAVYNFFNMFHKDAGAHFTYNMGVGMMRTGLFCLIAAILLGVVYSLRENTHIRAKDKVNVMVTYCEPWSPGYIANEVRFFGRDSQGRTVRQTQCCTYGGYRHYSKLLVSGKNYELTRYSVSGRDDYISYHNSFFVKYEYYWAYPDTPRPVPVWLIPVLLFVMVICFIIGKKQINISMKYPRSDIQDGQSGTGGILSGRADRTLLSDSAGGENDPGDDCYD